MRVGSQAGNQAVKHCRDSSICQAREQATAAGSGAGQRCRVQGTHLQEPAEKLLMRLPRQLPSSWRCGAEGPPWPALQWATGCRHQPSARTCTHRPTCIHQMVHCCCTAVAPLQAVATAPRATYAACLRHLHGSTAVIFRGHLPIRAPSRTNGGKQPLQRTLHCC